MERNARRKDDGDDTVMGDAIRTRSVPVSQSQQQRPRRNVSRKTYEEDTTMDMTTDENENDDVNEEEDAEEEEEEDDDALEVDEDDDDDDDDTARPLPSTRRNAKRIKIDREAVSRKTPRASIEINAVRKSSRSTQFRKSLAEPTTTTLEFAVREDSTDDDHDDIVKVDDNKRNHAKGTTKKQQRRDVQMSPRKSPAKRHIQPRQILANGSHIHQAGGDSDDSGLLESQHDEGDDDYDDDDDDDEEVDEADVEDEEPLKIQRIIASRTETISKWQEICRAMNTSEVHYGSRWYQEGSSPPSEKNGKGDDALFEERFLVKWADLSYLHVSWETEQDLIDQVDGQAYLKTFFRKSTHGLLYSADERCDGAYYDPAYLEIDRILEVQLPDDAKPRRLTIESEGTYDATSFGMIVDKEDPNFDQGTGRQFLIKWCNMPYSESTYEFERDLIMNEIDYKTKILEYLRRVTKPTKSVRQRQLKVGEEEFKRLYTIFGTKSKLSEVDRETGVEQYKQSLQQTVYKNGGQLRDYQAEGVAWMMANIVNRRGSILADEMGLGKTLQTAATVNLVANTFHWDSPVLIVAPLSTLTHWYREFVRWTDMNVIVYHGTAADRRLIRENEFAYPDCRPQTDTGINQLYLKKCLKKNGSGVADNPWMIDVVITSPEVMTADDANELTAVQWELLVIDEAHRLKNHKSKLSIGLRGDKFTFRHRILLTGTPIQNDVQEFWSLLNFIDPDSFDSLDAFMAKYGDMKSKESVDSLHDEIRHYILRRLKEDVEKSVPPKEETLIEVELTVAQKQYYRALYEKNLKFLHKGNKKTIDGPSLNNLAMQLRKCCNHLFLLNGVESDFRRTHGDGVPEGDFLVMGSGKLILLDKLLPRLKEEGHRVILFSQFKIMLDIVEDYLRARGMVFERIDGSITGNKRQQAIDRFQAESSDKREVPFIMLLSTRAGGVGITLTAADTCIIFDSDWNPQNDLQAQARCHRIGQTKSVKVYRLLTRKTYEMQMFHMSSLKMGLDQVVLKGFESNSGGEGALTKAEVEKLLRHGAYDIFNEENAGEAEAESNAFVQQDIDSILQRRSHTILHDHTGSQSNAAGGTFSKASFKTKTNDSSKDEDVDIEDPDFWTKMIGKGNIVDDEQILDQRRTRTAPMNYSEREDIYEDIPIADEESLGSEEYCDDQRVTWGGSRAGEWQRDDVETVITLLSTFGYGRLPWTDFLTRANLSKVCDSGEVQRMCWSLVLFSLIEAVDENAEIAIRRDEKQLEKTREVESSRNSDGGILANNSLPGGLGLNLEARKANEFSRIWDESKYWNHKLIADVISFAAENTPRSTIGLYTSKSIEPSLSIRGDEFQAQFDSLIWPSLKLRGWTSSLNTNTKMLYIYGQNEYDNIEAVLVASISLHPEIANVANSILERVLSLQKNTEMTAMQEKSQDLALSQNNASYEGIKNFLCKYGPIQLVHDRLKSARRIRLPRAVFSSGSILRTADTLVQSVSVHGAASRSIDELAELIQLNCKAAPPHPLWTCKHDAVLVHAISKHGWIHEDLAVRAIAEDALIDWGLPFGLSKSQSNASDDTLQIVACADRVVDFFSKYSKMINETKNFNQQRIINAYGLRRVESDDGREIWLAEGYASTQAKNFKPIDLPPKKDLVKRSKAILSRLKAVQSKIPEKSVPSHNYTELDVKDGSNIFLVEILRAAIKESTTGGNSSKVKFLMKIAVEEARQHAAALSAPENSMSRAHAESLLRIADHIDLAAVNLVKRPTQSKNVLRAILGEEPVSPRKSEEGLFPPAKTMLPKLRKSDKPLPSSRKGVDDSSRNRASKQSNVTYGDRAVTLSRERLVNHYSDDLCLELTEIETIILSTACSLGIPVWNEDWEGTLKDGTLKDTGASSRLSHYLTWQKFGLHMVRIAEKSLATVKEQLDNASTLSRQKYDESTSIEERRTLESAVEFAIYNFKCKELVSTQAKEYTSEPETLAKKAIMLLEKLRRHMPAVIINAMTTKSDCGLGSKVLGWFRKELLKWATSLDILDDNGRPFAFTAVEFLDDLDESERTTIEVSSVFDKRSSRSVICQTAMLTRLRSIYMVSSLENFYRKIICATDSIVELQDFWRNQPENWDTNSDVELVRRLLENGFGEALRVESKSSYGQAKLQSFDTLNLSNESIQLRANQLTRELHLMAEHPKAKAAFHPTLHTTTVHHTKPLPVQNDDNTIDLSSIDD